MTQTFDRDRGQMKKKIWLVLYIILNSLSVLANSNNLSKFNLDLPLSITSVETMTLEKDGQYVQIRAVAELLDIYPNLTIQMYVPAQEEMGPQLLSEIEIGEDLGFPAKNLAQGKIISMKWNQKNLSLSLKIPHKNYKSFYDCQLNLSAEGFKVKPLVCTLR